MIKSINRMAVLILGSAVALMVVVSSCKPKDEQQERIDKVKEEVIEIHDDAMAKMGQIMKLKQELSRLKSEVENDSVLLVNLSDLTKAHDGMMKWMRSFSAKFPEGTLMGSGESPERKVGTLEKESLVQALEEELESVKIVAEDIDKAILNAERTLEQSH